MCCCCTQVRSDIQRLLSWLITKDKAEGHWNNADVGARQRFIKPSTCTREARTTPADLSLSLETGAGVVVISLAMTTLGLLCNMSWRCSPWERRRRREWQRQRASYREACKALGITDPIKAASKSTPALRGPSAAPRDADVNKVGPTRACAYTSAETPTPTRT